MKIDIEDIDRLKTAYYEKWDPEQYYYMTLEIPSGAIVYTNNLDCDGDVYFCYESFLEIIKKWEE